MAKNKAAFGIYSTQAGLENAIGMLRDESFASSDVAVLLPESASGRDLGTVKATKAPEGATAGAGSGAVVGGVLGWLVGIGSLAIPGVGPWIATGPIVAALAGVGVGGAVGGLAGALVGMGIPEYEAKRYERNRQDENYNNRTQLIVRLIKCAGFRASRRSSEAGCLFLQAFVSNSITDQFQFT